MQYFIKQRTIQAISYVSTPIDDIFLDSVNHYISENWDKEKNDTMPPTLTESNIKECIYGPDQTGIYNCKFYPVGSNSLIFLSNAVNTFICDYFSENADLEYIGTEEVIDEGPIEIKTIP